jgi:NAD(P)-dependent dehydrogenase (short-subunit alcohol dehydrogenase family)
MRGQGSGRIVNITSMGGRFAAPFGGWYHATKWAVEALSDSLRQEVAGFGIDVVVVEPGAIRTEWGGIAMQSAREVSGRGAYAERVARMASRFDRSGDRAGSDPEVVARAISRAVSARRPRTRYAVGAGAKPVIALKAALPDRAFDSVLRLVV